MVEQRIDQRPARAAWGRMHDHAGGLVDHDQVAILPDDRQGDVLGQGLDRDSRVKLDAVGLTLGHLRFAVQRRHAVPADSALLDHPGQTAARQGGLLWHKDGKRLIKADRGGLGDGDEQRILLRQVFRVD